MQKEKKISQMILIFLGIFGFSIGFFDNYRELWMNQNGLSISTISHVIFISYVVTILVLLFFTIKVSPNKIKKGITITLILKIFTSILLLILNNTKKIFWIKFIMFFDISFTQLIVSSIYPLMMTIKKSDILYTKKSVVESISNKLGFLFVSIFLGNTLGTYSVSYNTCLLLSLIFTVFSFIIFLKIPIIQKEDVETFDISKIRNYFQKNQIFSIFLFVNFLSNLVWGSIMGMPMLMLTQKLHFQDQMASFLILGLGIISNILALIIVKYLNFKKDSINLFIKFGFRVCLYLCILLTGSKWLLLGTIIYLLLTDCTHSFIFTSFFTNHISEKYSLFFTILRYASTLLGTGIGTFFCGLTFQKGIRFLALPAVIFGLIHYFCALYLLKEKKKFIETDEFSMEKKQG